VACLCLVLTWIKQVKAERRKIRIGVYSMKTLFILNDPPYGTERSYNALRLAGALSSRDGEEVRVFLVGDGAGCGKSGQKVPSGFYNLQLMLAKLVRNRGEIGVCGTCMDARAIAEAELVEGAHRSTLEELANWTQWAEKVIVF
jgi:uncharacterized protein involved in oxidation of intracellular sulfur